MANTKDKSKSTQESDDTTTKVGVTKPESSAPAPVSPVVEGYTQEQLNSAVEDARNEEKVRLLDRLDGAQQKIDSLTETVSSQGDQLTKFETENEALKTQVASLEASIDASTGKIDTSKLLEEMSDKVGVNHQKQSAKEIEALTARLAEMEEANKRMKLDALAKRLIEEANGEIIDSLVVGNTEDELRASAQKAKDEYKKVVLKHERKNSANRSGSDAGDGNDSRSSTSSQSNPPPIAPVGSADSSENGGGSNDSNSSKMGLRTPGAPAWSGANRRETLDKIRKRYSGGTPQRRA